MTDFDPVADPDDRPDAPRPAAVAPVPIPRRPRIGRWGRVFRWWLALGVLSMAGIAACVFVGIDAMGLAPLHVTIDGNDFGDGLTITGLTDGGRVLVAVAASLAALLVVLLVPLLILLVVGALAFALVLGIGAPLVALALVLAVGTSPVWLAGLAVWLLVRRRDSHRLAGSATMPA